ncbi:MAG: biotin/lipoyl-binding protein, partial [Ruminococcus sp.]|nr:biotin/lipoyl-binding protein [Ruminococcus sp.]
VRSTETPAAQKAPVQADSASADGTVVSPMPGTIVQLMAAQGDKVSKGQPILVLEAMKMENEITAAKDGVLSELRVAEGQTVAGGEILFTIG